MKMKVQLMNFGKHKNKYGEGLTAFSPYAILKLEDKERKKKHEQTIYRN